MFRRPNEDSDDDEPEIVRAKPMDPKYSKKLGITGKDFVKASDRSQQDFYGKQDVNQGGGAPKPLDTDERNRINAKIMKAEMKGDTELVKRLKRKLESGYEDDEPSSSHKVKVLMKQDKSGNLIPVASRQEHGTSSKSSSGIRKELEKDQSLDDMIREEKAGTSEDQLRLFERSLISSAKIRRGDDESVDDIAEMQKGRRKHEEKDARKKRQKEVKEHKRLEGAFDACTRCFEGKRLAKHCVIAVGINTYLAVAEWEGMGDEHLLIIPMPHTASTIQLDENVWDEMRIWRKGLVAMWKKEDMDCVFLEMAYDVKGNQHCVVEAIPVPFEAGDSMPIYFHKAIEECESEWSDNKKLIKTQDLRKQIPRGFDYFAVDFGLQNGYAHVIEDREAFPKNFAHEILGGILELPPSSWRNTAPLSFDKQKARADKMKEQWDEFDWTKRIDREA
ncbi:unnamed protein product, partial [Mesorhabditis spiculigera]